MTMRLGPVLPIGPHWGKLVEINFGCPFVGLPKLRDWAHYFRINMYEWPYKGISPILCI
jgi:hypothetical protein